MNREELINEVLNQILQDAKDFDLTAIEELIKNIPDEALMAYLPEATEQAQERHDWQIMKGEMK